ncbi:hypothetical protein C8R43DRAFT_1024708 [Mycena crocata]|nr:hypothetical protein C8R43DRAFT_1024708 [Mycena crocata]
MIITSDSDLKDIGQVEIVVNRAEVPDDPPPAYINTDSQVSVASGSEAPLPRAMAPTVPASVKPTNFLSMSRGNGAIKGTYVIDPRLTIPQSILPPLAADETEATRRNVFLHTSNGAIDVDVFVIGGCDTKRRVDMLAKTSNGAVTVKLHADHGRPPIRLNAQSSNGQVTIHVPRSFRGPLTLRTRNGTIRFSDALSADLTTFNEVSGTRRCFVGDFSDWADQRDVSDVKASVDVKPPLNGWLGDEISVDTSNGSIKVKYDSESLEEERERDAKGKGKSTFFGRLLGL